MTTRPALLLAALLALPAAPLLGQHDHDMPMVTDSGPPPLYQNLGHLHRAIRTSSAAAQQYFDQGLRLTYAFNHAEAIRSFQQATALDSSCAMCWWGIANALGPNINMPMDTAANAPAYAAMERARMLAAAESPRNRALMEATAARYAEHPPADRAPLDSAYANRLRAAAKRFPDDPDIGSLFAESLLDLRPWNQWTSDEKPQPGTLEGVATLEAVMAKHPNHVGACHFYIHTIEAGPTPEKALRCARVLPSLMPGAGHLVHMPAHIAIRLGDYLAAVHHNQHAVHADQQYFEGPHVNSIYGVAYNAHNLHFLSVAAAFAGMEKEAIGAARETAAAIPADLARQVPPLEFWTPLPYFALVRFGHWQEMLAEPAPPSDLRYTLAMWHFSHGMAAAQVGDLDGAKRDADSLRATLAATPKDAMVGLQSAATMLAIADHMLMGTIGARGSDGNAALLHFGKAIEAEDRLLYDEPPPWYLPVRQWLGAELLALGRPRDAESVYRADLVRHRENGWSLSGLHQALAASRRPTEAKQVKGRLERAWRSAEVKPTVAITPTGGASE